MSLLKDSKKVNTISLQLFRSPGDHQLHVVPVGYMCRRSRPDISLTHGFFHSFIHYLNKYKTQPQHTILTHHQSNPPPNSVIKFIPRKQSITNSSIKFIPHKAIPTNAPISGHGRPTTTTANHRPHHHLYFL